MGGGAAKSALGRFFPTEAYAIAVPVGIAVCFFTGMVTRVFVADPDMGTSMTERSVILPDEEKHAQKGIAFKQHIRKYFEGGQTTIFNNNVVTSK